jgi:hypothetical protein
MIKSLPKTRQEKINEDWALYPIYNQISKWAQRNSQLVTLNEVFPHASHSWTQQSYALPIHFVMVLPKFIHILIG